MNFRCRRSVTALTYLIFVSLSGSVLSLRCKRCSLEECKPGSGMETEVQCRPEHTDCATSILRSSLGTLKANSVFERYCYVPSKQNTAYRRNTPHCQKNDRANVEVCVCQGDLCNEKLPPCKLRNYGNGQGCSH